jgi:alpha-tubulin suppressor-like RCC1 family protein
VVLLGTWHAAALATAERRRGDGGRKIGVGSLGEKGGERGSLLWVWGDNSHGQLGTGCRRSVLEPLEVEKWWCDSARVVRFACFATHTGAVTVTGDGDGQSLFQDGKVFTWGNNSSGQASVLNMSRNSARYSDCYVVNVLNLGN